MAESTELKVITTQLQDRRGAGEWERENIERSIEVGAIKNGFEVFLGQVKTFLEKSSTLTHPEFQLDEVSLMAEVSPEGEFKLIGSATPNSQGGIRLTLRRRHTLDTADLIRLFVGTQDKNVVSD